MLIEKNIAPDDVVTLRLSTGEELIAKVSDISGDTLTITRPLALNLSVDPKTNQLGLQMIPTFMMAANADSKFTLHNRHVICVSKAADDAKAGYIRNTTNLVVPGQNGRLQV